MKMSKFFRCTALLLCIALFSSFVCFAAPAEKSQNYKHYFALGSSMTYGIGLTYDDATQCYPGAYPFLLADMLDIDTVDNYGMNAMRCNEALALLGFGDYDELECGYTENRAFRRVYETREQNREKLKDADLISLELGVGDIVCYSAVKVNEVLDAYVENPSMENTLALFRASISGAAEGYQSFRKLLPELLEDIREFKGNDDYTLVLVGTFNPLRSITLHEELPLSLGDLFASYSLLANQFLEECAEKYNCIYVDISDTETGAVADNISLFETDSDGNLSALFANDTEGARATHPSAAGQQYIALQIAGALENATTPVSSRITVRLSVAAGSSVTGVFVDSSPVAYQYDDDTRLLTVETGGIDASRMTVFVRKADGNTQLSAYLLTYSRGEGYSTHCLYTTGNVLRVVQGSLSGVFNALRSLRSKLAL